MGEWQKAPSGVNCQKKLSLLDGEGVHFDAKGYLTDKNVLWNDWKN